MERLSEDDFTTDGTNPVDTSFVKTTWNCFDESALEMLLKLSEQSEGFGIRHKLDAVTIGGILCDNYLKTLYALGFEKAVRIECGEELSFWPELTAKLITEYMRRSGGQDVLVMGIKSADGGNGKTPLLAAEQLGWPCVTQVIGIEPVNDTQLKITNMVDGGIGTRVITVPCVLSVGDAPCSYLRVPTLKDRMQRGKRPIEVYTMQDLGLDGSEKELQPMAKLQGLEAVRHKREGVIIEGDDLREKVDILYHSYLKGRVNTS